MKKYIWGLVVIVVIVAIISIRSPFKSYPVAVENRPLQISAILSLTGPAAFFGEETKNGMDLANASNAISINYEDSMSSPTGGASDFSKILTGQNKDLVVISLSSVASAVMPQAISAGVPVLQTLVSATDVASKSPYTFRYFTSGGQESPIAADIALKDLASKKPAMIYSNDEYGISYFNAFKSSLEKSGISLVASATFTNKDTDYRDQLTKIKSTNPDAIYIIGLDKSLVSIIKQAKELGIKANLITNWILSNPSVISAAGTLADGVYLTTPAYNFETPDPVVVKFRTDYQAKYGKAPSAYAAIAYDIVNILSKVTKSSTDSGLDVVSKIKALGSLKGVMGDLTIDANKEITFALYPAVIKDGKIVTVDLK